MRLIELKPEKFSYCGKSYKQSRYISEDKKFFFTMDDLDYCCVYTFNEHGKGHLLYDLYHQGNRHSYPIYDVQDAIEKIKALGIIPQHEATVHPSQYKKQ